MTPIGESSSEPEPANGGNPPVMPQRSRRVRPALWVLVGCAVALALAIVLFVREAVAYQRIQSHLDATASPFDAARKADARELAPEPWAKANGAMAAATAELRRQQERFVLFRSYAQAHELLTAASDAAEEARAAAEAARARADDASRVSAPTVHVETRVLAGSAQVTRDAPASVAAARASLNRIASLCSRIESCQRALRATEVRKDIETVRNNIEAFERQLRIIEAALRAGDQSRARTMADTLKGMIDPIARDLEGIAVKFKCK